jgi:hypothetical protein
VKNLGPGRAPAFDILLVLHVYDRQGERVRDAGDAWLATAPPLAPQQDQRVQMPERRTRIEAGDRLEFVAQADPLRGGTPVALGAILEVDENNNVGYLTCIVPGGP